MSQRADQGAQEKKGNWYIRNTTDCIKMEKCYIKHQLARHLMHVFVSDYDQGKNRGCILENCDSSI